MAFEPLNATNKFYQEDPRFNASARYNEILTTMMIANLSTQIQSDYPQSLINLGVFLTVSSPLLVEKDAEGLNKFKERLKKLRNSSVDGFISEKSRLFQYKQNMENLTDLYADILTHPAIRKILVPQKREFSPVKKVNNSLGISDEKWEAIEGESSEK
jgi:hypothetical protein